MKLIQYKKEIKHPLSIDEGWARDAVVSNANSALTYIHRMLQDYEKLQVLYNEATNTETFKPYETSMAHSDNNIWNTKEKAYLCSQRAEWPARLAELEANVKEVDERNKEVKAHNERVLKTAVLFLERLGFKTTTTIYKRSKPTVQECAWYSQLKNQVPSQPLLTSQQALEALKQRIKEGTNDENEKIRVAQKAADDKAAEEARKRKERQEVLLIAHTCLKYNFDIENILTMADLEKELIKIGEVPKHVLELMALEIAAK